MPQFDDVEKVTNHNDVLSFAERLRSQTNWYVKHVTEVGGIVNEILAVYVCGVIFILLYSTPTIRQAVLHAVSTQPIITDSLAVSAASI